MAESVAAFTVLDLFSGIGGFSLAAEWTGGRTIAFAETAEYPSRVLKKHWPDVPNLGDVRKLCRRIHDNLKPGEEYDPDYLECSICGVEFGDCECIGTDEFTDTHGFPDVITGGVPCQPASLIGGRRGTSDERWLWPEVLRIMGELRPRFGLFENPTAILNLESGRPFNGILSGLARLGYDVLWECVPASAFGAGHRRERVWILAADSDCTRLERYPGDVERSRGPRPDRPIAAPDLRARRIDSRYWYRQSGIQPVVNGLPGRLVREQLTAIGNSVVPQAVYAWMRVIANLLTPSATTGSVAAS